MTTISTLPTMACVVITKNEETNIQDCLRSVQWANELIVIDAESCDRTVELARASGAKVSCVPGPVSACRRISGWHRRRLTGF